MTLLSNYCKDFVKKLFNYFINYYNKLIFKRLHRFAYVADN
jgi:hypothetical protein